MRVGLQLDGKRVPRARCAVILHGDEPVGEVTSGTFSPTLERPIAMAYVKPTAAAAGHARWPSTSAAQHDAGRTSCRCRFIERGK